LQAHHSKKLHPEMSNRSKYSKNIWHDNWCTHAMHIGYQSLVTLLQFVVVVESNI
jgi:hypothetical protein